MDTKNYISNKIKKSEEIVLLHRIPTHAFGLTSYDTKVTGGPKHIYNLDFAVKNQNEILQNLTFRHWADLHKSSFSCL